MEEKYLINEGKLGDFFKKIMGFGSNETNNQAIDDDKAFDNVQKNITKLPNDKLKTVVKIIHGLIRDRRRNEKTQESIDDAFARLNDNFENMSSDEISAFLKRLEASASKTLEQRKKESEDTVNKIKAKYGELPQEPEGSVDSQAGEKSGEKTNSKQKKSTFNNIKNINTRKLKQFITQFDNLRPDLNTLKTYINNANKVRQRITDKISTKDFTYFSDILSNMKDGDKINLIPIDGETQFIEPGDYLIAMKDNTGRPVIRFGSKKNGVSPVDILKENKLKQIVKYFLNK